MTAKPKLKQAPATRLLILNNCKQCPHCTTERTRGAGYALDYICTLAKPRKDGKANIIAGYVEWPSEEPKDHVFPRFCLLEDPDKKKEEKPSEMPKPSVYLFQMPNNMYFIKHQVREGDGWHRIFSTDLNRQLDVGLWVPPDETAEMYDFEATLSPHLMWCNSGYLTYHMSKEEALEQSKRLAEENGYVFDPSFVEGFYKTPEEYEAGKEKMRLAYEAWEASHPNTD